MTIEKAGLGAGIVINEDGTKKEQILVVALQYFQQNSGFARLFEGFKEKYASLGYVGGTVQINNIKEVEKNALSGFLGKDLSKRKTVSISAEAFQKSLNSSRFDGISVEELVNAYFFGNLVYKKHTREQESVALQDFFQRMIEAASADKKTIQWMQGIIREKHAPYKQIIQEYHENPEGLFRLLTNVMNGISQLSDVNINIDANTEIDAKTEVMEVVTRAVSMPMSGKVAVRLPVFAAHMTGDPHYFDKGAKAYIYLLHGLHHRIHGEYMENSVLNAEGEAELLYRAGLMKDDLSNFVMCFGIRGYLKVEMGGLEVTGESVPYVEAEGESHRGMEEFFNLGEPVMLSLRNLNKVSGAYAIGNKVFVVENPAVFGALIGTDVGVDLGAEGKPQISAVCSAGQPNLAVLVLLDMLAATGAELHYSGDFDPEGILIADRLKLRYGAQLKLWHYTEADYEKALSEKGISERRLKQLDKLQNRELRELGEVMKRIKMAGYQEKLLEH